MHLDEGTIHAWLDDALSPEEAARVERHVSECAACAEAVAEARGLVAGASRILAALDDVPGGVVPSARAGSLGSARPRRSLWRVLHFTPARAAAAALVIVAAGTVLVVRHAPNDNRLVVDNTEAGPGVPGRQHSTVAAPAPQPALPAPSPTRRLPAPASPPRPRREAAFGVGSARDTSHVGADSLAEAQVFVKAAPPIASAAPEPSPRAAVIGGIPVAGGKVAERLTDVVTTSRAGVVARAAAPSTIGSVVGCYAIEADSLAGLPHRVALDSVSVDGHASERRARAADASVATHMLRTLDTALRDSSGAAGYWEPTPAGGVRLYITGNSAPPLELQRISPLSLRGTMTIGDRTFAVTLQRTSDCPPR